mgnify:CR=1 FL=1
MTTRSRSPYVSAFMSALRKDGKSITAKYSDFDLDNSNHGSNTSFKYDPLDYPLKSTQQLNVDWAKFEEHTFFSSAEVKVNEAFNRIINGFPFDGSKKEVEQFLDSLTGFEKWVYDEFPRWSGALHFSGTQVGEDPANGYASGLGTWIEVVDKSGNMYPELAKNNKGEVVINPDDDTSLSIEALVYLPTTTNSTQVVFQKASTQSDGFTFYISPSNSLLSASTTFCVCSGSVRNAVSHDLTKGTFNHVCLVLNKDTREDTLQFYLNESLVSSSAYSTRIKKINADEANFTIGSGSTFYSSNTLITPTQTFSGTMDDLRVFHSVRDESQQRLHVSRGVYSTPELKLYYRFNEPSGSLSINNSSIDAVVLDSSGNSLHSTVNNFDASLRVNMTDDEENVMVNEKDEFKVVLFPAYADVVSLNRELLLSASAYDRSNPNMILRLIPPHYLLEGASQDGFTEIEGTIGQSYGGQGIPGEGEIGGTQIILTFLYIWAKFFDEIKMFVDAFGTLKTVGYDNVGTVPDNFLEDLVRSYGFYLPKFFTHSSVEQFTEGQNIEENSDSSIALKSIQSSIMRRVLVNMPDIVKSKGTKHSIRSFLRSVGIDPDNSLKIREYGGPTTRQLSVSRETRHESSAMTVFSTSSLVTTPYLSCSRVEPGFPEPVGSFYTEQTTNRNGGTNYECDGLLMSGSWNIECVFKIPPQNTGSIVDPSGNQSLLRLLTTGSATGSRPALIANVVTTQKVDYPFEAPRIDAYFRPGSSMSSPLLTLSLELAGDGMFDGDRWNVAFGSFRNDDPVLGTISSSYYLRAAKIDSGELSEVYTTSSYFYDTSPSTANILRSGSTDYNSLGSYVCIGGGQSIHADVTDLFLNNTLNVDDIARTTDYAGWACNLRVWSKGMDETEWKEHARNPKSVGVNDPFVNYNFTRNVSGSFQKLRVDTLQKQQTRESDSSGEITFLDFALGLGSSTGVGFPTSSKVLMGDVFSYSYLSPEFDEASTDDKVRIKSYEDPVLLAEDPWAVESPSYLREGTLIMEEPQDDLRLSLEFSLVDSLDKDIVSMFATLDRINNMIGSPELMFSPDYPDLERLRDVYFNRLSSKPNFKKFFEFYKWFDVSVTSFVEQLIPSKTIYKGTNFVVESHMLERHKNEYRHSRNYAGEKQVIDDSLLVQQIVGKLRKY